jgi:hypothetical protein
MRGEYIVMSEPKPTIDEIVKGLEEAHAKATAGEWAQYKTYGWVYVGKVEVALCPAYCEPQVKQASDNANFLALAHNLLPALIKDWRRLKAIEARHTPEPECTYNHRGLELYGAPCPECGIVEGSDMK